MSEVGGETTSAAATAAAASTPTPWFLYFMILLLVALVVLIGLYCAALSDPDFPSRHHRGPNVTANAPRILTSRAALIKPITGPSALPHEIPFELHRFTQPKASKLIHAQRVQEPQPQSKDEPAQPPQPEPSSDSSLLERASNMINLVTRQNMFGLLAHKQLTPTTETGASIPTSSSPSVQNETNKQIMIASLSSVQNEENEEKSVDGGPVVKGVDWESRRWLVHGSNFESKSQVVFGCEGRRLTGQCRFVDSASLRCKPIDGRQFGLTGGQQLGQKSDWKVTVTNPDSQSGELTAGLSTYYISFLPPGVPRRLAVQATADVGIGLFIGGKLDLLPSQPVSIWFEVLQEEDDPSRDATNSISSRDRYQPPVIKEVWTNIQQGVARFNDISFPCPGKFTLRATAVQTLPQSTSRKIIAPIIESFPIIIR